jgi:parallel beta-helix repeat protein
VINRFAYAGIIIQGGSENVIEGNYIGTDVTGTIAQGNSDGIRIEDAPNNLIGGNSPAARNIISGNERTGMEILWSGSVGNTVQGNYIGTDATGTAGLGNRTHGIHTYADTYSVIGPGNVVSDNGDSALRDGFAILLTASNEAGYSQVIGNLVGTDVSGTMALGNFFGIAILGQNWNDVKDNIVSNSEIVGIALGDGMALKAHNNTITGNTVRSSGGFGIQIEFSNGNLICNNSFIDNQPGLPAVDHGGTGNIFNLDKPLGGNFWSDWTGPDNDNDGFVDLPYPIWTPDNPDGNDYSNQDNYPWASQGGWQNGNLILQLEAEVKKLKLHKGLEKSICEKMEEARKKLDENMNKAAVNLLEASIKEVEAQKDKKIEKVAAEKLIEDTKKVISVIEKKK